MSYNTADNTAVLLLACQQSGFKTTTRHPDTGDTCDDTGAMREVYIPGPCQLFNAFDQQTGQKVSHFLFPWNPSKTY